MAAASAPPENKASTLPAKLGRFEILRILGKGAQGVVYLGLDPQLQRQVAIKALHPDLKSKDLIDTDLILQEARTTSRFQHPNIVSLYEAGEGDGQPYLVMEYVDGQLLSALIKKQGAFSTEFTQQFAEQLLDGLAYAHNEQIVHSDLKPANIILTRHQQPKIMDFGIARLAMSSADPEAPLVGSPRYMAPEYISHRQLGTGADIFAVGLILYEMLTGQPAVPNGKLAEIFKRITSAAFVPPNQLNPNISATLSDVVLKALHKDPNARYRNADEMRQALREPAQDAGVASPTSSREGSNTTEFLMRRIKLQGEFPTLSSSIINLNQLFSSDNESANSIAAVILKDFALTNKLLRVVNSAHYARAGGKISTISRAIVVMGIRPVRDLALSLVLIDNLSNQEQASQLQEALVNALFSGILGRRLLADEVKLGEEVFLCSMFHRLGELLTQFYLHEEWLAIQKRIAEGQTPTDATTLVLGTDFEGLGTHVAEEWGFPEQIIESMRRPTSIPRQKITDAAERRQLVAACANELCEKLADDGPDDLVETLSQRYGKALNLDPEKLELALAASEKEFDTIARILKLPTQNSAVKKGLERRKPEQVALETTTEAADASAEISQQLEKPVAGLLNEGVNEITQALSGEFVLDDLLRMILENIYRALGFDRTLLALKNGRTGTVNGRHGFGTDIDQVLPQFKFPIKYEPDVFHLALYKGADLVINDIDEAKIKDRIPVWYRQLGLAQSFLLFPVQVNKQPVALIYCDRTRPLAPGEISDEAITLIKQLRDQATEAIKTRLSR